MAARYRDRGSGDDDREEAVNCTTIFGWTQEQWEKAYAYFNLINKPPKPFEPDFAAVLASQPSALWPLANVQKFWRDHRTDEPASVIVLLDDHRWTRCT